MDIVLYGMIALYFVGVALLVLVIAFSHSPQPERNKATLPRGQGRTLAYGVCAAVFVLLSLLTIVIERGHSQMGIKHS